jgi:diadenosine tetraphosphatase ApaH/serine/threonine PP2A family protein phosphatase
VQRCFLLEPGRGPGKSLAPVAQPDKGKQTVNLELKAGTRYLVNPGSVGQPRDNDPRAAFLVYDTDANSITFYRVPYDIPAAQKKIISAGLPERLATRLAEGR